LPAPRSEIARLIAAAPELLDALYTALPFIEDAEESPEYKPGYVKKVTATIRAALAKADVRPTETTGGKS